MFYSLKAPTYRKQEFLESLFKSLVCTFKFCFSRSSALSLGGTPHPSRRSGGALMPACPSFQPAVRTGVPRQRADLPPCGSVLYCNNLSLKVVLRADAQRLPEPHHYLSPSGGRRGALQHTLAFLEWELPWLLCQQTDI